MCLTTGKNKVVYHHANLSVSLRRGRISNDDQLLVLYTDLICHSKELCSRIDVSITKHPHSKWLRSNAGNLCCWRTLEVPIELVTGVWAHGHLPEFNPARVKNFLCFRRSPLAFRLTSPRKFVGFVSHVRHMFTGSSNYDHIIGLLFPRGCLPSTSRAKSHWNLWYNKGKVFLKSAAQTNSIYN